MSSAATVPGGYRPRAGAYDELADAHGQVREAWDGLVRTFGRLGPDEIDARRRLADRLLVGEGASYVQHEHDTSRPPRVDPVPLVWPQRDWAALEAGLSQRATLLQALLDDVYGPQDLLRRGVIPAELVLGSPWFRWPAIRVQPAQGPRLVVYAADLVRDASGRLVVLRDHTDAPGGAGYALVNRRVLTRLFPDVYRDLRVERLSGWFTQLRASLAALSPPDRGSPRTVVLTPGIGHPSYFEHTYLASYLGYHLVEGQDLAVRGGRVWLRALAGLEPVDVILRRVEDAAADPLELGGEGPGGVAGLLEAAREQGVGIANALGSGAAGDVALHAYLEEACRALLGEPLRLPSLPTYWLGDPDHLAEALANWDDLVVHDLDAPIARSVFTKVLTDPEQAALRAAVEARPRRFVTQPRISLATAPVLEERAVVPGTVVVRIMAVASAGGWAPLPGGLGRVVRDDIPILRQRDGAAKDVWVLADDRPQPQRAWSARGSEIPQVDLRTSLPSRVAEALFWVGRNAERAETIARLSLALVQRYEQAPELAATSASHDGWIERIVAALRAVSGGLGRDELDVDDAAGVRRELAAALGDRNGALADCLNHLATSAGSVREYLSTGTWRVLSALDARRLGLAADAAKADLFLVAEDLDDTVLSLMALGGLAAESIVRGPGWRFLDLGRRTERAVLLLGLVEATLVPWNPDASVQPVYETLLTTCESLVAYRRRHRSDLELDEVCDLLLADDTNPRSLAFQIDRVVEDLAFLPDRKERRQQQALIDGTARLLIAAGWLDQRRPARGGPHVGLQQFVLDVRGTLLELVESLVSTWFAHAGEAHLVQGQRP
jgi:uncharacterized circularly permuted ATP-grasp superfamily protein/uncharacterized alpha-E superfamily protein